MAANVTRIIGIDFGTSTSVVCVKRYRGGEPVSDEFSSSTVTFGNGQADTRASTVVRRNGDGTYTCGREAEDAAPDAEVFREFKMELESADSGKRANARTLTEEFFKYLYRWYDHQRSDMGEVGDREKTIVSFPAKWSEETREFMAEAARKAGFPDVSVMDEPSAALYATLTRKMNDVSAQGLLRSGEPGYMLLVDMGAGTTDLAVCRYSVDGSGIVRAERIRNEIVSTWPESAEAPTFGGREVDRLLENYLTEYMTSCGLDTSVARQLVCGSAAVKPWKENTVSVRLNDGKAVETCGFISGYMMLMPQKRPFAAIDRTEFETLLSDKLEEFKSLVTGCLDKACSIRPAIAQNGLDLVVLTGGHSVWYFTEELLNGTMTGISHPALKRVQTERSRVIRLSNPQETVALGLVYSMLPVKAEEQKKVEAEKNEAASEQEKSAVKSTDAPEATVDKKTEDAGKTLPKELNERLKIFKNEEGEYLSCAEICGNAVQEFILQNSTPSFYRIMAPASKSTFRINNGVNPIWSHDDGNSVGFSICQNSIFSRTEIRWVFDDECSVLWCDFADVKITETNYGCYIEIVRRNQETKLFMKHCDPSDRAEFIDLLRRLQNYLREYCPGKNWSSLYPWGGRLENKVIDFFKDTPVAVSPNRLQNLRIACCVPDSETILFAKDETISSSGKRGFVISPSGIYRKDILGSQSYTSWEEWIQSAKSRKDGDVLEQLTHYLREQSMLLESGS